MVLLSVALLASFTPAPSFRLDAVPLRPWDRSAIELPALPPLRAATPDIMRQSALSRPADEAPAPLDRLWIPLPCTRVGQRMVC